MNRIFYLLVVLLVFSGVFNLYAQGPPSPPGLGAKQAPIDMGLSLLLIVGAGLGIKKLRKNN